jgi:hypothetical protein
MKATEKKCQFFDFALFFLNTLRGALFWAQNFFKKKKFFLNYLIW